KGPERRPVGIGEMKRVADAHWAVVVFRGRRHIETPNLAMQCCRIARGRVLPLASLLRHEANAIPSITLIEATYIVLCVSLLKGGRKLNVDERVSARRSGQSDFDKSPLLVLLDGGCGARGGN